MYANSSVFLQHILSELITPQRGEELGKHLGMVIGGVIQVLDATAS